MYKFLFFNCLSGLLAEIHPKYFTEVDSLKVDRRETYNNTVSDDSVSKADDRCKDDDVKVLLVVKDILLYVVVF